MEDSRQWHTTKKRLIFDFATTWFSTLSFIGEVISPAKSSGEGQLSTTDAYYRTDIWSQLTIIWESIK
jgi:hypothetical protein